MTRNGLLVSLACPTGDGRRCSLSQPSRLAPPLAHPLLGEPPRARYPSSGSGSPLLTRVEAAQAQAVICVRLACSWTGRRYRSLVDHKRLVNLILDPVIGIDQDMTIQSLSASVFKDKSDTFGAATPLSMRIKSVSPGLKLSSPC